MKSPIAIDLTPDDYERYMEVRREKIMKATSAFLSDRRHLPADEQGKHSVMGRVDYRRVPVDVLRDALQETTDSGSEFTEHFMEFWGQVIWLEWPDGNHRFAPLSMRENTA